MLESSTSSVSDRINEYERTISTLSSKVSALEGRRSALQEVVDRNQKTIDEHNNRINNLKLIEAYLANFADERQAKVYRQLEATVSEGLRTVFEEDLSLEVSNKMVGSRAETVFTIVSQTSEGELRTSIMDSRGGGVAAIVGFLIQAVLVLLTPQLRPVVFLDESFKNVSEEYQAPLGEFIKGLCERTGLQVVLVTHQPTITEHADSWYEFHQVNGNTAIKKMR